jgi:predicted AAA+ superfamily ATPase
MREDILPKLELLKARLAGRLQGVEEYKKSLNYVATYANAKEGKEADALLKRHTGTGKSSLWRRLPALK